MHMTLHFNEAHVYECNLCDNRAMQAVLDAL